MKPSLSDLILFIDEQITFLNDHLFSRDAASQCQEKKGKYNQKKKVKVVYNGAPWNTSFCLFFLKKHQIFLFNI